jgi:hypothetical protein
MTGRIDINFPPHSYFPHLRCGRRPPKPRPRYPDPEHQANEAQAREQSFEVPIPSLSYNRPNICPFLSSPHFSTLLVTTPRSFPQHAYIRPRVSVYSARQFFEGLHEYLCPRPGGSPTLPILSDLTIRIVANRLRERAPGVADTSRSPGF